MYMITVLQPQKTYREKEPNYDYSSPPVSKDVHGGGGGTLTL